MESNLDRHVNRDRDVMRYGKQPRVLIDVTTKPRGVQIWAKSLQSCNTVPT